MSNGQGGVAALMAEAEGQESTDLAPAAAGSDNGGAGDPDSSEHSAADEAPADSPAPWYGELSREKSGSELSDAEWMANKGFADLPALLRATRQLESQFLAGDKVLRPKEDDAPEAWNAYYKAIGRPDEPTDYEVPAVEGQELDEAFVDTMRATAFEAGIPAAMFAKLAGGFNAHMQKLVDETQAEVSRAKDAGIAEIRSEWGKDFAPKVADANKAIRMLELDPETVGDLESGLGTARTMRLLQRLGAGMAEDALLGGGASMKFGVSPAEAQAELDQMAADPTMREKVLAGDAATLRRRETLMTVIAAERARAERA